MKISEIVAHVRDRAADLEIPCCATGCISLYSINHAMRIASRSRADCSTGKSVLVDVGKQGRTSMSWWDGMPCNNMAPIGG